MPHSSPDVGSGDWTGNPVERPDLALTVLHHQSAAIVIADRTGRVRYANEALAAMFGGAIADLEGTNIIDHIHSDDLERVAGAFFDMMRDPSATNEQPGPWAPISCRLTDANGRVQSVEVTGSGALLEQGLLIYEVRETTTSQQLGAVLNGLATAQPLGELLDLVLEHLIRAPLHFRAAVVSCSRESGVRVLASTDHHLRTALEGLAQLPRCAEPGHAPHRMEPDEVPSALRPHVDGWGATEIWVATVTSAVGPATFAIFACGTPHEAPPVTMFDRLQRAQNLAGVVLLRAHTDEALSVEALHDPLTGLPNRAGFEARLADIRPQQPLVALYLDLDGFKDVNDHHGHAAGDLVLAEIANRLQTACRPDDFVARFGGDEFVIVIPHRQGRWPSSEIGRRMADRVLFDLRRPIDIGSTAVTISASIGIVETENGQNFDPWIRRADAAMYAAKRSGGGLAQTAAPTLARTTESRDT